TGVTGVIVVIGHPRAWCVISHGATFRGSQDICVAKRESTAGEKSNGITDQEAPAAGTVATLRRPGGVSVDCRGCTVPPGGRAQSGGMAHLPSRCLRSARARGAAVPQRARLLVRRSGRLLRTAHRAGGLRDPEGPWVDARRHRGP